jgi:hypothetical protein
VDFNLQLNVLDLFQNLNGPHRHWHKLLSETDAIGKMSTSTVVREREIRSILLDGTIQHCTSTITDLGTEGNESYLGSALQKQTKKPRVSCSYCNLLKLFFFDHLYILDD